MSTPPRPEGSMLTAREVCDLLHIARSTLPLWRGRGDLLAERQPNGHWRYPSTQPTIRAAIRALRMAATS